MLLTWRKTIVSGSYNSFALRHGVAKTENVGAKLLKVVVTIVLHSDMEWLRLKMLGQNYCKCSYNSFALRHGVAKTENVGAKLL